MTNNLCVVFTSLLLLLVQAFFVNGISMAASGSTETLPDGSEKDSEMILYPIKKWLMKTVDVKVFYTGERLVDIISAIRVRYSGSDFNPDGFTYSTAMFSGEPRMRMAAFGKRIEKDMGIVIEEVPSGFTIYKIEKKFIRSKWLRQPTFGCIKCMPSIWGTLTFWPIFLSFVNFDIHSIGCYIFVWILDIVCLVPVSLYISNKLR